MALEIGVAYLSIIPSTRGMIREIKRSLNEDGNRVARQAGQDMGRSLGKGMGDGFGRFNPLEGVEAQVNKAKAAANDAAKEMEQAREKAEKAARKAQIAETEYHEAVDKSGANTARAMRALDKYREAKRQSGLEGGRYLEALSREQMAASNARREADGLAQSKRELAEANELASRSFQTLGERFRSWRRGEGTGPKLQVDVDGTTLERRMAELTSSISARHKIRVNVDYDRGMLRNISSGIARAFSTSNRSVSAFGEAARGAFSVVSMGIGKIVSQIPGTWVILGALGAMAAITFGPLIASAGQLVNLLALIPAVASGALAAIGGIVAGSLGIFKALGAANKAAAASGGTSAGDAGIKQQKAITKAQDQAARTAEQGAKRVAKAERSLADAQKASQRAQEDLNDARSQAVRDLEDMNARLAESSLDEEGAILAVRRAYDDLWNTTSDPSASMLDRQEANLRYRQSINSLERIRRENERLRVDTAEANKAGVEGSDEVVAAKERVAEATRAVEDAEENLAETVKDAARANADAQDAIQDAMAGTGAGAVGAAGGVDEFAEAMANLSPSAREFVESILDLKGAWTDLRLATQESLFKGLGPAVKSLADNYFPILKNGLVGFNTEFNTFFHNVIDRLNSPEIQGVWSSFYENARLGLGPMLEGFNKLGEAFAKLSEIGSRSFPRIGEAINGWADGVLRFIDANPERIHGWIDDAVTAFGKLMETGKQVLRVIKNIFAPGTEEGQAMWDKINETLASWADTIGDPENQESLKKWFEEAKTLAADIKTIIEATAGLIRLLTPDGGVLGKKDENGVTRSDNMTRGAMGAERGNKFLEDRAGDGLFSKVRRSPVNPAWHVEVAKEQGGNLLGGAFDRIMSYFDANNPNSPSGANIGKGEMQEHYERRQAERKPVGLLSESARAKVREGGDVGPYVPNSSPSTGAQFQGENRQLDSSSVSAAMPDPSVWETTKQKFQEMSDGLKVTYDTHIVPLFDGFNVKVGGVKDWFSLKAGEISTAWSNMSTGVQTWYDTTVKPTWDRFTADGTLLGDGWSVVTSLMSGDWGAASNSIQMFTDNHITPALDRLRTWLDLVRDKFGEVKDSIGRKWDELRGATARPINFLITDVWNNGLLNAWRTIRRFLPDLPDAQSLTPIAFAEGGPVPFMSGARRGKDSVNALLMPDEHVWDVRNVSSAGGHGAMYQMRNMVDAGRPFTWVDGRVVPAGHGLEPQRFEDGGAVSGVRLPPSPGEGGLKPIAMLAKRLIHRIWPSITTIGGYRQDAYPEHPSGRALDVMVGVGNPIGDEVTSWALANDAVLPLIHALWKQTVWMPSGATQPMGDRGNPTQNHMDHPHLWYHPKDVDPNVVPDGLVGHDGLTREDRLGVIKEKITEIIDKTMNPVREAMAGIIGTPPPELLGIPPEAADRTKEAASERAFEFVENIADDLKDAYKAAREVKDVVVNTVFGGASRVGGAITSYFRDTGGFIPAGESIVRNETGRPEAVLNWQQLDRIKWLMADAAAFASQFAQLAPIAEALSNAAMGVTRWQDMSAQERWSPYQQQVLRLVKDIRQVATDHGFGPEAEAIAGPIVDSIENLDWDFLDARMSKTFAEVEKVGEDAGKAWVDDAAGVFGLSGISGKIDAWDQFGRAMSGDLQTSPSVPTPSQAVGDSNYTSGSRTIPLTTKMPDFDAAELGHDPSGVKATVQKAFAKHGWDKEPFWSATDWIVNKESTWNPTAQNPSSTAFGLFQFLDSTWAETGVAKTSDPALQAAAGATYIKKRYGDPVKAKAFWEQNGWYDRGGVLKPGTTLAQNDSGKDELILTNEQWRNAARTAVEVNRMAELSTVSVAPGRVSGGDTININALDLPGAERMFRLREAQKAQRFVGVR